MCTDTHTHENASLWKGPKRTKSRLAGHHRLMSNSDIYIYIYIYMCVCLRMFKCVEVKVFVCLGSCIYIYMCVCVCVFMEVRL